MNETVNQLKSMEEQEPSIDFSKLFQGPCFDICSGLCDNPVPSQLLQMHGNAQP